MPDTLTTEDRCFRRHIRAWLASGLVGKFVVIRGEEVLGVFPDEIEALKRGHAAWGRVAYLVREITEKEPILVGMPPRCTTWREWEVEPEDARAEFIAMAMRLKPRTAFQCPDCSGRAFGSMGYPPNMVRHCHGCGRTHAQIDDWQAFVDSAGRRFNSRDEYEMLAAAELLWVNANLRVSGPWVVFEGSDG